MLINKTENTDLLSLLAGNSAEGAKDAGATGEFAALLDNAKGDGEQELLDLLGKGKGEAKANPELLAKLAEGEGQKISPELLAQKLEQGADEKAVNNLFKNNSELPKIKGETTNLKNGKINLENIDLKQPELLQVKSKQAPQVAAKKMALPQGGDDFVKNMAMINKNQMAMVQDGKPVVKKLGKGLSQYKTESKALNESLIEFPKAEVAKPNAAQVATPMAAMAINESAQQNSSELMGGKSNQNIDMNNKVLDLSQTKASNPEQLIQKISNYIEQSYVQNKGEIDVTVHHNELGQFNVKAQKAGLGQQVDLEISTATQQGKIFFAENEPELIKTLTQSGVKLSNLKIVNTPGFAMEAGLMSDNKGSQQQSSMDFGGNRGGEQFQRGQGSSDQAQQDSQRRRNLWEQMQQQYAS